MSWVNKNLKRKAWNYVTKIQVRLNDIHSLFIQRDPLSVITFLQNTGQRDNTTEQKQ